MKKVKYGKMLDKYPIHRMKCIVCGEEIKDRYSDKYCSEKCYRKMRSQWQSHVNKIMRGNDETR